MSATAYSYASWERQMSPEVLLLMNELTGSAVQLEPVVDMQTVQQDDPLETALEILAIPAIQRLEILHSDGETLVFLVRAAGWKLKEVTFSKSSLRALATDDARQAKIEYLRRDLMQAADRRSAYRYPRTRRG